MGSLWNRSDQETLEERGWQFLTLDPTADLCEIADALGTPRSTSARRGLVNTLRVTSQSDSRPNSLSSRYGTEAFPYHTDGAIFRTPPRYGIMRLAPGSTSNRPTLLLDFQELKFP